jgi:hypothetical protein
MKTDGFLRTGSTRCPPIFPALAAGVRYCSVAKVFSLLASVALVGLHSAFALFV